VRLRVFRRLPAAVGRYAVTEPTPFGWALIRLAMAVKHNAGLLEMKEAADAIEAQIKEMIIREIRHRTGN